MPARSKDDLPANVIPLRPRRKTSPCPICKKPAAPEYQPFCSKRCADVDLHRWLGEAYRAPAEEQPSDPAQSDDY